MEPINNNMLDGIKNYLSIESTGALMVSGEWGCGKTYPLIPQHYSLTLFISA